MGRPPIPADRKISNQLTKVAVFDQDHDRISQFAKHSGMAIHTFLNRMINDPDVKAQILALIEREKENRQIL